MSAKYVAATVAGRALKYQLTKAEQEASYDMFTNIEQFKKLLEHGRSHNWSKFEQELGKIYDKQMALRSAYRGAVATENQPTQ
jgi:succinate dehydrogenase/fumarate reductase flavoprotein subunit